MTFPDLFRFARAAMALLLLAGCGTQVVNPVSGRSERTVMDEPSEIAEGRKAHQQVLTEYGALASPRLQTYVNDVGQKLAKHSHRANLQWTFTVLDSPEINAFALPGGYVYVTRGIMAYMDSEADLAGVIGHEIGHVTARHGAQRATSEQNAGIGVLAATVLGVLIEGATGAQGVAQAASQLGQGVAARPLKLRVSVRPSVGLTRLRMISSCVPPAWAGTGRRMIPASLAPLATTNASAPLRNCQPVGAVIAKPRSG